MPSFKPKAAKKIKIFKKYLTSLDAKHTEMLEQFSSEQHEIIPKLANEKAQLEQRLEGKLTMEERLDIKDKIKSMSAQIRKLKSNKTNYLLDNSKYIFEYFENKKRIDETADTTESQPDDSKKTNLMLSFLKFVQQLKLQQIHHLTMMWFNSI